jgi:hypothetical protein
MEEAAGRSYQVLNRGRSHALHEINLPKFYFVSVYYILIYSILFYYFTLNTAASNL